MRTSDPGRNFLLSQGLAPQEADACPVLSSALLFQPRMVGLWILIAAALRSAPAFLALAAVLWWSALLPRWNPFDLVYNRFLAGRSGRPRLGPARPPRRFAQRLAGAFALGVGLCILAGAWVAAVVILAVFLVAVAAIAIGRFCLGSFVYHLLCGRTAFALRTLPWGDDA